uniref:Uncharacterized protein n=1 Tax=Heterorhabditis bacteriophora TaxID=37862 RepID=A0A1I7WLX5_HETBA
MWFSYRIDMSYLHMFIKYDFQNLRDALVENLVLIYYFEQRVSCLLKSIT